MPKIAGRQVEIGIGMEATPGTPVAATDYFKWDNFSFQSISEKAMLNSARGIRNKDSNSLVIRQYGKGAIEFTPTVDIMPYVLGLTLGTRATALSAGESAVYDHTFTVQNNNASMKTATILVKQGSIQTERYANCVVDSLEINVDKDLLKGKINFLGQFPDTGSMTAAYTQDTMLSRNQMNANFGTSFSTALGTKASTTLTSTATAPANNSTITLGSFVYTYKTVLTGAAYEVLINTTAAAALINLKKAINNTGTPGTDYGTGTLAHPFLFASTITTTTLLISAIVSGTAANALATTQAGTSNMSFPGATMNSGTPGTVSPSPFMAFSLTISNNVLFDDAFLSGSAGVAAGGYIAGPLEIKGSYTQQYSDTVGLAKYQQNTKYAFIVTTLGALLGVTPTFEQLTFKLGRLVLTKEPITYQLDNITLVKQEFTIEYDATDKEITAVVTNTADGTNY